MLPCSAEILILVRLRLLNAVSVAEKNADMVTKISITIIVVVLSIRLKKFTLFY